MPTKLLKICGLTDLGEVRGVLDKGADLAGLIFYPPSARDVSTRNEFLQALHEAKTQQLCGVFVDHAPQEVIRIASQLRFSAVQLSGEESPEYCANLRLSLKTTQIFKTIRITEATDLDQTRAYLRCADRFVFESLAPRGMKGGTGTTFDWKILETYRDGIPFLLSGGIGPHNLANAFAAVGAHPQFGGLDLNSKVEITPGRKDLNLVAGCIEQFRTYANRVQL